MFGTEDSPRDLRVLALSQYAEDMLVEVAALSAVRTMLRPQFSAQSTMQHENLRQATSDEKKQALESDIEKFGSIAQTFQLELDGDAEFEHCIELVRRRRAKHPKNKDQPMSQDNHSAPRAPWMRDFGSTFAKKTYGRIWVRNPEDVGRVVAIIGEIDEFEASYLPDDFVAVLDNPEDARLVYGHKFELRTDLLEYACWKAGIEVWIVTGASDA